MFWAVFTILGLMVILLFVQINAQRDLDERVISLEARIAILESRTDVEQKKLYALTGLVTLIDDDLKGSDRNTDRSRVIRQLPDNLPR